MSDQIKIYYGNRDNKFTNMIKKVFKMGKLKNEYISKILEGDGLNLYKKVFTHPTADSQHNYESLEILGDSIVNCCIVWYLSRRFPQLNCPEGVKIIARLKINLVSKKMFADFGYKLGFWPYVSADMEIRQNKMKPTLEDVFEAFFGATQKLVDEKIRKGVGYSICYNITEYLFDQIDISLKYEDLYDAKTRLKELFDVFKQEKMVNGRMLRSIGQLKYVTTKDRATKINYTKIYRKKVSSSANDVLLQKLLDLEKTLDRNYSNQLNIKNVISSLRKNGAKTTEDLELIGEGSASLKPDSEQKASEKALEYMKKIGYVRDIPNFYKTLY